MTFSPALISLLLCTIIVSYLVLALRHRFLHFPFSWGFHFLYNYNRYIFFIQLFFYGLLFLWAFTLKVAQIVEMVDSMYIESLLFQQYQRENLLIKILLEDQKSIKDIILTGNEEMLNKKGISLPKKELSFSLFETTLSKSLQSNLEFSKKTDPWFLVLQENFIKINKIDNVDNNLYLPTISNADSPKKENDGSSPTSFSPVEDSKEGQQKTAYKRPEDERWWGKIKNYGIDSLASRAITDAKHSDSTKTLDAVEKLLTTVPGNASPRADVKHSDFIALEELGEEFKLSDTNKKVLVPGYLVSDVTADLELQKTLAKANLKIEVGQKVDALCGDGFKSYQFLARTLHITNVESEKPYEKNIVNQAVSLRNLKGYQCVVYPNGDIVNNSEKRLEIKLDQNAFLPPSPTTRFNTTPGTN